MVEPAALGAACILGIVFDEPPPAAGFVFDTPDQPQDGSWIGIDLNPVITVLSFDFFEVNVNVTTVLIDLSSCSLASYRMFKRYVKA